MTFISNIFQLRQHKRVSAKKIVAARCEIYERFAFDGEGFDCRPGSHRSGVPTCVLLFVKKMLTTWNADPSRRNVKIREHV